MTTTTFRSKVNKPKGTSTLATGLSAVALTFDCASGEGANFPSSGAFTVSINDEIILIDSRSTDTFTVNASGRGYDGTTAAAHSSGDSIYQFQIVKDFTDLEIAVNALEDGSKMVEGVWIQDDGDLFFGTDKDIRVRYDEAGDNQLEWHDGTNLLMALKDTGSVGTLHVTGNLTMLTGQTISNTGNMLLQSNNDQFYLYGAAGAGSDPVLHWYGQSDASTNRVIGSIFSVWEDDTNGAEVGSLSISLIGQSTPGSTAYNLVIFGSAGITIADAYDIILKTTTGTKIGTATNQKLGFWNATPVTQQSGTGETTGFTAGSGTGVNDDSTFTGNVGATAYRINDVVKALKNIGLLAQ